ncbi:hypothetical protein AOB58_2250 [Staphylococcus sp. AntiMn-1]|nr:hypothetical protein [Staphylococcus sp. AntiMn-1]ANK39052.1 hypothetical protein AOB58_2250 [Staphylococcus sp. AntiMn-1]
MTNIAIGLIPSPDMPHKLINKISDYLADDIHNHVDDKTNWDFETHVASMVGTAEHMDKALDIASNIKNKRIGTTQFVSLIYQAYLIIKL